MASKRAWIRTDSSVQIGGGHVMRCLALAEELHKCGVEVIFLCRNLPGNLSRVALAAGHRVELVNDAANKLSGSEQQVADAAACTALVRPSADDWLVVDHYGLDQTWESRMRGRFRRILVIDDLADRPHDCDILLDQNRLGERVKDYATLVMPECKVLAGPGHALLARQFRELRQKEMLRDGRLRRIMVFFGSSDEENHTRTALEGISLWGRAVEVDAVIGDANPHRQGIEAQCLGMASAQLHVQTADMARLTAKADCAIGAAGSATWERCCLGLPSLLAVCAANQEIVAETAVSQRVAHNIGPARELTSKSIAAQLNGLTEAALKTMEMRARALVDGGGSVRLVREFLQ